MSSSSEGFPLSTILIGASAIAVFAAAGYVLVTGKSKSVTATAEAPALAPSASAKKVDLVPPNPFNITPRAKDAKARAELWHPKANLTKVTALARAGRIEGELNFEFGAPVGRLLGPVEKERFSVVYKDDDAKSNVLTEGTPALALPEPNCPLESAVLSYRATAGSLPEQFGIVYGFSRKHGRPVWSFTSGGEEATNIDADSCVMLRK